MLQHAQNAKPANGNVSSELEHSTDCCASCITSQCNYRQNITPSPEAAKKQTQSRHKADVTAESLANTQPRTQASTAQPF
jgi:hypothetical protein